MTVAVETATTNQRLNQSCRAAYKRMQGAFDAQLAESGYARPQELATFITTAIESGIILSRVHHTGASLRQVAEQLRCVLRAA
jgi:TetR/AcrR family transcriptional regulator, lmrAB and yxaGH operons repressor